MNQEYVINDAVLIQVSDISNHFIGNEPLREFYNYILNYGINTERVLDTSVIANISNMYILCGLKSSDKSTDNDEKQWKDILSEEQYKTMQQNGAYVLGFISLYENDYETMHEDNKYITYMDTRLKGYDLGKYMMLKCEEQYDINLHPKTVMESNANYWKKYYLPDMENIEQNDIDLLIEEYGIDDIADWEALYELCVDI